MYVQKLQSGTFDRPLLVDNHTAIYKGWVVTIPFNDETSEIDFTDVRRQYDNWCPDEVLRRIVGVIHGDSLWRENAGIHLGR